MKFTKRDVAAAVEAIVNQPVPVGDDTKQRGGSFVAEDGGVLVRVNARYRNPVTGVSEARVQASAYQHARDDFSKSVHLIASGRTVNAALSALSDMWTTHEARCIAADVKREFSIELDLDALAEAVAA